MLAAVLVGSVPFVRLFPKPRSDREGVDPHVVPPGDLVAAVVELTVVIAAERHGELIADFGAERPRLGEADVVRVGRGPAAQDARLRGDVAQMVLVTDPSGLTQNQHALIDPAPKRRQSGAAERGAVRVTVAFVRHCRIACEINDFDSGE